jgi:hypothetical protein
VSRISPFPTLLALALVAALGALPACGTDGSGADDGALGATPGPTTATPSATLSATPTRSRTPKPKPAPSPSDDGGDGDDIGDDAPVTMGGGVCARIRPSDVAGIVGGDITGTGLSGGGCLFSQADRRAPEVTVKDESYAGMDAAKTEATSAVEGEPEDLSGIGRGAFVVTGTIFGGTEINGAGAVHVGSRTLSVMLVHHTSMSGAKVRALVVELLKLVATA